MRILHVTPSYKPAYGYGGPTISVSRLCETQARLGHSVDVLTTRANGAAELAVRPGAPVEVDGVTVRYFNRWTGDHSHFSPALLWFLFRQARRYDVVHIHSWWNLPAMLSVPVCHVRGVRPVVSPRGMLSRYTLSSPAKRWFHRLIGARWLAGCRLHATSPYEAADLRAAVLSSRPFTAANIIPLADRRLSTATAVGDNRPWQLVYMARLTPVKGLELLLEALAGIGAPYELHVAGTGEPAYEERLRRYAEELGLSARVRWVGWLSGAARFDFLAHADLFVLSSQTENFANAALEALSVGTPVLLSDQVGLASYVVEHGFGWSAPYDVAAFRSALERILAAPKIAAAERLAMAQQVRRDFDGERVAQGYITAYRETRPAGSTGH